MTLMKYIFIPDLGMAYTLFSRNKGNDITHPQSHSSPKLLHTHLCPCITFTFSMNLYAQPAQDPVYEDPDLILHQKVQLDENAAYGHIRQ